MTMLAPMLADQVTALLTSAYKPILVLITFLPWAWLTSSKLDRDARYFHLEVTKWNAVHLAAGFAAMAAILFIPIFWIGWPVAILLLVGPVLAYWKFRNDRVPESQKFFLTGASLQSSLNRRKQSRIARDAVLQFEDSKKKRRIPPDRDDPSYQIHLLAEDVIGPALDARASHMEMLITREGSQLSQTIDGVRYKREAMDAERALSVHDLVKDLAGLDVSDRRKRQSGDFYITGPGGRVTASVTAQGSSGGIAVRLDFDRAERLNRSLDTLGMLPSQLAAARTLVEDDHRHGIVLVSAPSGHGLSTTAYALLGQHDAYTSNIKTLERDVMMRHDGIDHAQFDATSNGPDYATTLQSILRRDPDIVLADAIRDAETGRAITEPAMEGPLIYVPVRAGSLMEAIQSHTQVVGDPKRAAKSLRAVVSQRLVRTLCPQCKQAYQPSAEQLQKLSIPAGKVTQLFRANGKVQIKNRIEVCPVCRGTGYIGQIGIFEFMLLDDEARKMLAKGDIKAAILHARRNKMVVLQEAALAHVASGVTSIDEILRVTSPPRPRTEAAA